MKAAGSVIPSRPAVLSLTAAMACHPDLMSYSSGHLIMAGQKRIDISVVFE